MAKEFQRTQALYRALEKAHDCAGLGPLCWRFTDLTFGFEALDLNSSPAELNALKERAQKLYQDLAAWQKAR